MTSGGDMPAPEMLDQWVITGVLGDNMKVTHWISRHGPADVIGESEIKGVAARGSETNQLHRHRVLKQLFDQGNIHFCLPRAYQQGEADSLAPDDCEIYRMDIFEINEDVIYRSWQIGGDVRHRILFDAHH